MEFKNKIKLGIIGFGRMGITHYSIINTHPHVEIVSVADPSQTTLDILKKQLPKLQVFEDYKNLIIQSKPNAVIVATPPHLHHPICDLSRQNNIHVFVEKPFTTSVDLAKDLSDKYQNSSLVNQVGYVNRFNDVFIEVRKLVKLGVIGEIVRFKSEMFSSTIIKKEKTDTWRSQRENGGGVVYEMAAHTIDLVNYIVGVPDKIFGSSMNRIYSKNVEDIMSSTFAYKNGCIGTIYVNWSDESFRKPSNKIEIFGLNGKILADQHGMKIFMKDVNKEFNYRKGWNTINITDIFTQVPFYVRGNEFTRQLYHFADTISGRVKGDVCTFRDGYNTQKIINDIFTDAEINNFK